MGISKILLYSDCFVFSGSENVIENILNSNELKKENRLVFYYAYSEGYKKSIEERFTNFSNIYSIPIFSAFNKWGAKKLNRKTKDTVYYYVAARYLISIFFQKAGFHDLYNVLLLYRKFKKEAPEILYINNGGYPGARSCRIAVISAGLAGIKRIVFNVNNLAFPQKGIVDKWLDNYINRKVSVFITASKAARWRLISERGFDESKCFDIPNTLPFQKEQVIGQIKGLLKKEFKIDGNQILIGSVGLLTRRKGFHILIEAIKILKQKVSAGYKLVIFGEGEERKLLEDSISMYGLENIVMLPGFKNNVLNYMKDFDIFVCPSTANEDFPYVVIEAMLLAKPVIGTNIAGIPEQVEHEKTGYIVQPANAGVLAEFLERLILDQELRKGMGNNGYKRYFEHFRNVKVMEQYKLMFESLINR